MHRTSDHPARSNLTLRSGLGLATCRRLIDTFLRERPLPQALHLHLGTRSAASGARATAALRQHLRRAHPAEFPASGRIYLRAHGFDLTDLRGVRTAAVALRDELTARHARLDALICNAGMSAFAGIDWPLATYGALTDIVKTTTRPGSYYRGTVGDVLPPLAAAAEGLAEKVGGGGAAGNADAHAPLGRVFCANVFGHYLLAAVLAPCMQGSPERAGAGKPGPGRIVFVSSIETTTAAYVPDDLQGLSRQFAYSSSKRLTDVLALTADAPGCQASARAFLSGAPAQVQASPMAGSSISAGPAKPRERARESGDGNGNDDDSLPRIYLSHPGVVSTDIVPLILLMHYVKLVTFYITRLIGCPWMCIDAHTGAAAATWLALAPDTTLENLESEQDTELLDIGLSGSDAAGVPGDGDPDEGYDVRGLAYRCRGGRGKWGSAVDRWGREKVVRTYAVGWGVGGESEEREGLEALGRRAWAEMEALRAAWEERLPVHEKNT